MWLSSTTVARAVSVASPQKAVSGCRVPFPWLMYRLAFGHASRLMPSFCRKLKQKSLGLYCKRGLIPPAEVSLVRFHHILLGLGFLCAGTSAFAGDRLDLPQIAAEVDLPLGEIQSIFNLEVDENAQLLPARETQLLIDSLPEEFRDGCRQMVVDFGPQAASTTAWAWSVRRLHVESGKFGQSALLAFRCTVHVPDVTYVDERLAILLNGAKTVLKLLALDKDCTNCTDLYQFRFSQRFDAESGYFAELNVDHTTQHPCCDGGDVENGTRFLLIAVPSGSITVSFDKETSFYNHDDEDGDTQTECRSSVAYERNGPTLQGLTTKTACRENGKFKPPVTIDHYLWDRNKEAFIKNESASSSQAPR